MRSMNPTEAVTGQQFLALLCATQKQSYCQGVGIRRPSARRRPWISISRKLSNGLTPNLVERYLSTIYPDHCFFKKKLFLTIFTFRFR